MDAYKATFGQHIRYLRRLRSLTQEEVAHRAGVHVTYLSGIERGVRNPSLKNIRAIAEALGVPMGELFAPEPVVSEPLLAEPVVSEPLSPEPVVSEPLSPEPVVSEPLLPEPVSLAADSTPTEVSSAPFTDVPVSEANPIYPAPES